MCRLYSSLTPVKKTHTTTNMQASNLKQKKPTVIGSDPVHFHISAITQVNLGLRSSCVI